MKVFALGGYGKVGLPAVKLLAQSDLITKIAVAGRSQERAAEAAAEIGEKAVAVQADGTDEEKLTTLLAGYDIIVNAASPETILPTMRAAIHNGAHYCDLSWGKILEEAMQFAPAAEAAGSTAILATGISPCISNLMGVHAARQLDEVKQFQIGRAEVIDFAHGQELTPRQWLSDPEESLAVLDNYKSYMMWMLKMLQDNGSSNIYIYHVGQWEMINPIKNEITIPLAHGGITTASPYYSGDDFWGTLPRDLAKEPPVDMWFSPFPPQLHSLLREQVLRMLNGNIDSEFAVNSLYERVASDPHHWLTLPEDYAPTSKLWVRAVGNKDGRPAQHTCSFTAPMWDLNGFFLTSVALVAAVFKILRGEVKGRGVMLAEKAFEPQSFFDEVVTLIPDPLPNGKLIGESFELLE